MRRLLLVRNSQVSMGEKSEIHERTFLRSSITTLARKILGSRWLMISAGIFGGSPSLRFLEHKMGRVFRSLAVGYGKPQRMKVQTIEQQFSLTEKNGYRRDVERVD